MSKLVMNIKNEQNMKAMVEWCKQYHIEFQIIEDNKMPNLVDDSVANTKTTLNVSENTKSIKKSKLATKSESLNFNVSGKVVTLVGYTPKDVFGVVRDELKLQGVEYSKGVGFTFKSNKDAKAYIKTRTEVSIDERNNFRKSNWGW